MPAYENWIESQTRQDLQAIQFNHNSIHMESLTIRERILTTKCPDVAHPIVFRGAVCADNGRFDRCESLWMHALELRQNINVSVAHLPSLNQTETDFGHRRHLLIYFQLSVQRDLLRFAQVFSQMIHVSEPLRFPNVSVSFKLKFIFDIFNFVLVQVLNVLAACVRELNVNKEKFRNPSPKDDVEIVMEEFEMNIITALYLCIIITKLLKMSELNVDEDERDRAHRLVYTLNRMNLKLRDGQTLMHLAVNGITPVDDFHTSDVCRLPCVDTVKLFLSCGASVFVTDCNRNTPLHTLSATVSGDCGTFDFN